MNELKTSAVVTGASRGIGRCIAETLAASGLHVIITYANKTAEGEAVARGIADSGGSAEAFKLDIADEEAVNAFFAGQIKDKVNLEVLVNNAGITRDGLLIRMKGADFDAVNNVNLSGSFFCLREAAKLMIRRRSGRIINITSVVGQMGNPGQVNYSASKAGLVGMTKSAAKELAARGITVNAVAPGFIESDMTLALNDDTRNSYMEHIPLKRFGIAQDVADAVAFLASDKAGYITGQVLAVNGGMYC